jgi:hypothetical protein
MRTHQSEFAALLHNTMHFTVPRQHVTHHCCLEEPHDDIDVDDEIEHMERDYARRPARLAKEMLTADGARVDDVHVQNCSYSSIIKIMKRMERAGWIKLESAHDHANGRPALHFKITDIRAMLKLAEG